MKIGRLDVGFWRKPDKTISWKNGPEYCKGICGCHIWTLGPIAITWLSDECLNVDPDCSDDAE